MHGLALRDGMFVVMVVLLRLIVRLVVPVLGKLLLVFGGSIGVGRSIGVLVRSLPEKHLHGLVSDVLSLFFFYRLLEVDIDFLVLRLWRQRFVVGKTVGSAWAFVEAALVLL